MEGGLRGDEGGEACVGWRAGGVGRRGGLNVRSASSSRVEELHVQQGLLPLPSRLLHCTLRSRRMPQPRRAAAPVAAPMLLPTLARLARSRKCCGTSGVRNSRLQGVGPPTARAREAWGMPGADVPGISRPALTASSLPTRLSSGSHHAAFMQAYPHGSPEAPPSW